MNVRCRTATVVVTLLLSCSLMFGAWIQLDPGVVGGIYNGIYFISGNTQVGYACGMGLDTISHMPAGLVIKTTDGGSSWMQQDPNTTNMLLAIYFSDVNTGYACGIGGTLVKTTDGGATWNVTSVGHNDQLTYVSFPSNGQTGYMGATSDTAKVYKSTGTWAKVGDSLSRSTSCAVADDSNGVAFGLGGFLWGTTDGFATGEFLDPNTNANIMAGAFSRGDPNKAYIVGIDTALNVGIIRYASTGTLQSVWDSVRCPMVPSFTCVDYPTSETAFVGGADGFIGGTWGAHDVVRTVTNVTNTISSICFPHGPDTGYAAAGPIILKTMDAGQPWGPLVALDKVPASSLVGIRVVSNPSRRGIAYHADAEAQATVFDAAGSVVARQNAAKGVNFLPLSRAGVYVLKATTAGSATTRKLVVER